MLGPVKEGVFDHMKSFVQTAPDVDAGNVVISVWPRQMFLFRSDLGQYVLSAGSHYYTAGSVQALADGILDISPGDDEDDLAVQMDNEALATFKRMIDLPIWQVVDLSVFQAVAPDGVTLLTLRDALEAGQVVSPLVLAGERPYCISKSRGVLKGFHQYTPPPFNDITASYSSLDELYARVLLAHFPIWILGESPAYRALEEEAMAQFQGQE